MNQMMRVGRAIFRLLPALAVLLVFSSFAVGQTNQGQVAGNVVDSTGAQVPNVKISAKNEATGSTYNAESTARAAIDFLRSNLGGTRSRL